MNRFLQSKFTNLFILFIVGLAGASLVKEVVNNIKIKKEIAQLQQESQDLQRHNNDLRELVDYLNSPAYQDKAAREHLNLQKPGEIAVALPLETQSENSEKPLVSEPSTNPQRWFEYFFGPDRYAQDQQ